MSHTTTSTKVQNELRDHVAYLMRYWWFVLIVTVAAAAVAFFVSSNRPDAYKVVQNYEIELVNRGATGQYEYGSYYDQQGSQFFVQHVMSLLQSAPVIQAIYDEAGIVVEIDNYNRFTNQFRTDQLSSQHFSVTYSQVYEGAAREIAKAMDVVLTERVAAADLDPAGNARFALRSNPPTVVFTETPVALATVVAAIAGLLLSIILVFTKRYVFNK